MKKTVSLILALLSIFLLASCASEDPQSIDLTLPAIVCSDYGEYIDQTNLYVKGTWNERERRFTGYVSSDYAPYSCIDEVMEQDFVIKEEANGVVYGSSMLFETPTAYKGNYLFTASVDFTKFAVYFNGYGFEGLIIAPAESMDEVNSIMENWIFKFG